VSARQDAPERDPALLALVRQTAIERDRWDLAYSQALQAARDGGWSGAEIGKAAGVRRQVILKMTRPPKARHGAATTQLAKEQQ
jgi:hypothetical protein